ncbi:MAG: integrase domain-containing protein [Proteobacteria bacterium]|nr:integrase domain-containing protein [Pseudomonadota bacterium]
MTRFNYRPAGRISGSLNPQPVRRPDKDEYFLTGILGRYRPGEVDPMCVLEMLINHFNTQHTAFKKTVSFKTRRERAQFLRRFFRDLSAKAGFKTLPDPRNLAVRHIRAIVKVWQREKLAPATVQTYLSFLRGLALWLGKAGLIQSPAYFGMKPSEYRRSEVAQSDKSWSAAGIDIDGLIEKVCAFDRYVGASLKLIRHFGLRRKESIMFRPHRCVVPFEATGLDPLERQADEYISIKAGAKGGRQRFIPLNTLERKNALAYAQAVAGDADAHMGQPGYSLLQNMYRFDYVMKKFGTTKRLSGVSVHGLRHEAMIEHYQQQAGEPPPVRGGNPVSREKDIAARLSASKLAGHNRMRAASAYLGKPVAIRRHAQKQPLAQCADQNES